MMRKKEYYPLSLFAVASMGFYLIFTHLIIKTDDGHFLGILNDEGFALSAWLEQRYQTLSGRTASEFLMMCFLKINPVFWKIAAGAASVYIVWFLQKLCSAFSGSFSQFRKNVFCGCVPFLVFIGALNPGAYWFAGSFTFLFPFTAFLMAVTPLVFEFFDIGYNKWILNLTAVPAAVLACSQEQTSALTIVFLVILLVANSFRKNVRFYFIPPLFFGSAGIWWLFSSPGMSGRMQMQSEGFSRFFEMKFLEKLLCGFSNYFGYSFFLSLAVTAIFTLLLFNTVRSMYSARKVHRFAKFFLVAFFAVCAGMNGAYIAVKQTIPDKGFEKMFKSGTYDAFNILTIIVCLILLALYAAMLLLIMKKNKKLGFTVALLFAASICSAVVLGFSSSIYASGQRVFYFTDLLVLFASAVLLSAGENKKNNYIFNASVIVALLMYILNCFNFAFLEIPIMG